ncbi:MAG: type II toxin-antitoxin system prevent-host-death family antitoxin [Pseudomonadales bacterium]|nr:type II toxin-antitoxin system prevent-host-death family antitoxin [Pseudomonadales bacterium]
MQMTTTVSIHDAKTNLSKYIAAVKKGQKVFIGGYGKPEVLLVVVSPADLVASKTRDFSPAENKITEQPDSFSDATELLMRDLIMGAT